MKTLIDILKEAGLVIVNDAVTVAVDQAEQLIVQNMPQVAMMKPFAIIDKETGENIISLKLSDKFAMLAIAMDDGRQRIYLWSRLTGRYEGWEETGSTEIE